MNLINISELLQFKVIELSCKLFESVFNNEGVLSDFSKFISFIIELEILKGLVEEKMLKEKILFLN